MVYLCLGTRTKQSMPYQSNYDKEASFGTNPVALLRCHHLGHLHHQCKKLQS
uniref:Uncharacterized protein n=1 Tax=Arundo donax TaxID=35708 RepID=A0A0A8ZHP9_ARUDO